MNIFYIGSSGPLSIEPLKYFLQSEHNICAVGIKTNKKLFVDQLEFPVITLQNESIETLAHQLKIPVINLYENDVTSEIRSHHPDIIFVSCFSGKLASDILSIPESGCYNLHPSLLPAYRGPVPLFWQLRDAVTSSGVSLHKMTNTFDAGPVIAKQEISMPDGLGYQQANIRLAELGVELLSASPDGRIFMSNGRTQDETLASTQSYPVTADFRVSTAWPARRIYNFMRGTQNWGLAYPCDINGHTVFLLEAITYRQKAESIAPVKVEGDRISLLCNEGQITARFDTETSKIP